MDEKIGLNLTYSWGSFYETLQELEGDSENEDVEKGLALIRALEKACTKKEIKKAIEDYPLTETQRLRMCSPCLDGILRSIVKKDPTVRIIKENLGMDAYKYFLSYPRKLIKPRLGLACKYGRIEFVKFMIKNIVRRPEDEALIWACEGGFTEIVKMLLDNFKWRPKTIEKSVYIVSKFGIPDILRLLIPYTETYLFSIRTFIDIIENAIRNSYIDTLKVFLENYSNWSAWALVFAIDKNHFDVAKTILDMEFIKIEQLQEAFISCKSTIIGNGFTDLLELFLKRGVVLNPIRFIRDWKTAQFFLDRDFPLTIDSFDYSQNLFDLLVEKLGHANLNIPADDLLLHAVFKRDKEAVKKLLLKGAKIEPGYITRSLWKYHFEFEIFKLLVDANAISPLNSE
jgi:hypothetical protein